MNIQNSVRILDYQGCFFSSCGGQRHILDCVDDLCSMGLYVRWYVFSSCGSFVKNVSANIADFVFSVTPLDVQFCFLNQGHKIFSKRFVYQHLVEA